MAVGMVPGGVPADAALVPRQAVDWLVSETLEDMERREPTRPVPPARAAARRLVAEMAGQGWLDELMRRSEDGGVELTGDGGFLPEMIKVNRPGFRGDSIP